jgi:Fe-Mn family superoxide dismutase
LRRVDTLEPRIRSDIRKHGGGHANHSLLWETMVPGGHSASATLTKIVEHDFHSFDGLQRAMSLALDTVFGSGWVFLSVDIATGALQVMPLPHQDSPLLTGNYPLLAFDAWEHAYYLQYHQDRSQWFKSWWTIVNWQVVEREYVLGMSGALT